VSGKLLPFVNKGVNMRLIRIARRRWEVLATCDHRGGCPVSDFLGSLTGAYQAAAEQMFALLRQIIPENGPPKGEPLCKSLGDGLYELRKQPKGKKLRVVWFYGGGPVIVCTSAFTKAERTPRTEIARAKILQRRYWEAKKHGRLEIVDRGTSPSRYP
jgi:phage-related protein